MLQPKFIFILIYKITGIIHVLYIISTILFKIFSLLIYQILYCFIFHRIDNFFVKQTFYLKKFNPIYISINKKSPQIGWI